MLSDLNHLRLHQLTLNRSLRPRRSQQAHTPHHEILKSLIARLSPLTHVTLKARDLRRRIRFRVLER